MPFDVFFHDFYLGAEGRWAIVGLFAVFGGVIGSFLNVVAYRLPRGMSLLYPGSQCPACGKSIRWYDNVPVLGWIWLGGRCRDCRARISIRYPVVELLVAVASVLLAWTEVFRAIPLPPPDTGQVFALDFGPYTFHMLLLCPLMAAALIEYDGHRPPALMLALTLVLGFAVGSIWPNLRPVGMFAPGPLRGVYDGAAGFLAAIFFAALAWPAWVMTARREDVLVGLTAAFELATVGVFLGAREVSVVVVLSMACYLFARMINGTIVADGGRAWPIIGKLGWAAWLSGVTLFRIVTGLPHVGVPNDAKLIVGCGLAIAMLVLWWRLAARYIRIFSHRANKT